MSGPLSQPEVLPAPSAPAPLPVRPVRRFPAPGERIGRFTLGEVLGQGGFAHVYRATGDDGAEVALKVLTGLQGGARERFEQETRLLEAVGGRGFPAFLEAGLGAEQPWFAMELVQGSTLRERVRETGPLDARGALRLAEQLASALLVLQEQRCLHRDLKPANVMVDGDRVVLIDLGIAKVFDASTSTQPVGTLAYMAPELFARQVHPRSDVYSLGLLLLFAATGTLPPDLNFLGRDLEPDDLVWDAPDTGGPDDAPSGPPVIDKHLRNLILAMTRYQPAHRPALESVARVLRARLAGQNADDTVLLTDRVTEKGATAAEKSLDPAAELAATTIAIALAPAPGHPADATALLPGAEPVPGSVEEAAVAAARVWETWHALVYDAALMSVLSEVHDDGFDGAAEQVIADHVASIGAHVADGRTPAEIKDWIWEAMRWPVATPPAGHRDTLRGWRDYRNPARTGENAAVVPTMAPTVVPVARPTGVPAVVPVAGPAATRRVAAGDRDGRAVTPRTRIMPASDAAVTQVSRPAPPTYPRRSPVQHLGPTPAPPSVTPRNTAPDGRTRPLPAGKIPAPVQPPAAAPRQRPEPARPAPSTPTPRPPAAPAAAPTAARPVRSRGRLLRLVPPLLLLAAVVRTALQVPGWASPEATSLLSVPPDLLEAVSLPADLAGSVEGPLLAVGALAAAGVARGVGHRTPVWFYALAAGAVTLGAVLMG